MNSKQTEADYVPYGPEWEKEMSKFPKPKLIKMLGKAYQEKKELKQSLPSKPVSDVEEMARAEADKWVFETNGRKWSNNDDTAGDNFGSYMAGFKSGYAAAQQKGMNELKKYIEYIEKNLRKLNKYTWEIYKDQIQAHVDDCKAIFDESPSPSEAGDGLIDGEQRCCNQCGGKLSEVRGRYPKQPKRIICPTCAIEELESMKQNNLTAKNNKDE